MTGLEQAGCVVRRRRRVETQPGFCCGNGRSDPEMSRAGLTRDRWGAFVGPLLFASADAVEGWRMRAAGGHRAGNRGRRGGRRGGYEGAEEGR